MSKKNDEKGWVNVDEEKKTGSGERSTFEVNGEKYTPYAVSKTYRFPLWLKAVFAKWWFPGMVFYFIFFGIGAIVNQDLLALVLGLAVGLVTDIFLNHYFRDFSSPNHDYTKFIIFGRKRSFFTLPVNLVVYVVLSFLSAFMINVVIHLLKVANPDEFMFALGGLLYATFMLAFDLIIVFIRNMITKLVLKIKAKKSKDVESVEILEENSSETENN